MTSRDVQKRIVQLIQENLLFHGLNKRAQNQFGLSLVQYNLLQLLRDRPGWSPQQLAVVSGQHPSSLTPSLKRLERKGYIHISNAPKDSRKKSLVLSTAGLVILRRFEMEASTILLNTTSTQNSESNLAIPLLQHKSPS